MLSIGITPATGALHSSTIKQCGEQNILHNYKTNQKLSITKVWCVRSLKILFLIKQSANIHGVCVFF